MNDISIINLKNNMQYDVLDYSKIDFSHGVAAAAAALADRGMGGIGVDRQKMPRRGLRTSHKQYEIYINYLQDDEKFCLGTRDPAKYAAYVESKWRDVARELNLCKSGPNLSSKQWQKVSFFNVEQ